MKKIFLQFPWKIADSPYYKSLVSHPPEGIEYLNTGKQEGVITKSKIFNFFHHLKIWIRRLIGWSHLPLINVHKTKNGEYDLIHNAHCLSKNKENWVADFEGMWQFYLSLGEKNKFSNKRIKNILLKENCKKIIAWTEQVKQEIVERFPEVENKIEVVYPAIPLPNIERKEHEGINLLFVARYFHRKGGLHALEAIDRLTKKYENVYGIIVADFPKELVKPNNPKIKFYELMSQEELFKLYSISDIFVYPGYTDSFGFGILESMSFGIPVVSVMGFAREELIKNWETGYVINLGREISKREGWEHKEDIVQEIVEKTSTLIENEELRKRMSGNCIGLIKNGKFSISERNKKLKEIYENV